jgi:2-polyprenyl-3-methyl-5-hydroxy-6-metoxy-1,4-benzoquinol methylase
MKKVCIELMMSELLSLELISCPICNSDEYFVEFSREDLNSFIPGCFRVVRCKSCDHMFLNPRPTTHGIKNQLYTDDYDQYRERSTKFKLQYILQSYGFHKRYKLISRYITSGRILDIGCASGDFLEYMLRFPEWDLVGLEPIAKAANLAREHLNLEIINNTLTDHTFGEEKFDVVTFWHVFEHVEDPFTTLTVVNEILHRDGIVVITLPILKSIDHRIFGKYWIGFELPRHFHFFSKEKILELLTLTGFEFLESRCLYGSHAMSMTSLKFWMRSKKIFSENFISNLMKILMSFPIRIILAPVYVLMDKFQLSTPVTFVAKRNA